MTGAADARSTVVMTPPANTQPQGRMKAGQRDPCQERQVQLCNKPSAMTAAAHLRLGCRLPAASHTCRRTAHQAPPPRLQCGRCQWQHDGQSCGQTDDGRWLQEAVSPAQLHRFKDSPSLSSAASCGRLQQVSLTCGPRHCSIDRQQPSASSGGKRQRTCASGWQELPGREDLLCNRRPCVQRHPGRRGRCRTLPPCRIRKVSRMAGHCDSAATWLSPLSVATAGRAAAELSKRSSNLAVQPTHTSKKRVATSTFSSPR